MQPPALKVYYERMAVQVEALKDVISSLESRPVAVNDLMYWFAFDNMGDFGFGHDFGMMRKRGYVDGASCMRSALSLLGPFSPAIWIPRIAFAFIPRLWKVRHWFKMLEFADSCTRARMEAGLLHSLSPPSTMQLTTSRTADRVEAFGYFLDLYRRLQEPWLRPGRRAASERRHCHHARGGEVT